MGMEEMGSGEGREGVEGRWEDGGWRRTEGEVVRRREEKRQEVKKRGDWARWERADESGKGGRGRKGRVGAGGGGGGHSEDGKKGTEEPWIWSILSRRRRRGGTRQKRSRRRSTRRRRRGDKAEEKQEEEMKSPEDAEWKDKLKGRGGATEEWRNRKRKGSWREKDDLNILKKDVKVGFKVYA